MANEERIQGYKPLAVLMCIHPDVAIFRKFSTLNALNLLYLQAELVCLESKLSRHTLEDHEAGLLANDRGDQGMEKLGYETNWYALANSDEDEDSLQWETILEVREILKEYNEAVSAAIATTGYISPLRSDLEFRQKWLEYPRLGGRALDGKDHA